MPQGTAQTYLELSKNPAEHFSQLRLRNGVSMRKVELSVLILLLAQLYRVDVANADTRVILSSDVRPGVYGRVEIGSAPPPLLVYPEPVIIVRQPVAVQPIYLHVPPGHAKHWSKHCREYNACGLPVYFVKSAEYESKKPKKPKKEKKKDY